MKWNILTLNNDNENIRKQIDIITENSSDKISRFNSLTTRELLNLKNNNDIEKNLHLKLAENSNKISTIIEKSLAKKCIHKWSYYPPTQLYDGSSYICDYCGIDKRDYNYYMRSK